MEEKERKDLVDKIVREAKENIPNITSDSGVYYLQSTSGFLRLGKDNFGRLYIVGYEGEYLTNLAKEIAKEIGARLY